MSDNKIFSPPGMPAPGRILSPTPFQVVIEYNEVTGAVSMIPNREANTLVLFLILSQLMTQICRDQILSAPPPAVTKP